MSTVASRLRMLGACLLALAGCLVALSVLGPLITGVIQWRIRPTILSQLYGLDAVSLIVVAPLAAVAGVSALRGQTTGALLGFAPPAYAVYMAPQYVLGPDYAHVAGDNERWFPLLLVLFALGVVATALAWAELTTASPARSERAERLIGRRLLPAVAAVVFVRYIPTLAGWMSAHPQAKDYVAGPNFSWTIALLDLGVALPATIAVCTGYRRAASWGRAGLYALTGWFALVGAAVAGMAIAMQLRHDPAMTVSQMLVMVILGGVLIALAAALYAPAVRHRTTVPRPTEVRPAGAHHTRPDRPLRGHLSRHTAPAHETNRDARRRPARGRSAHDTRADAMHR
jgi:hypothetical protein